MSEVIDNQLIIEELVLEVRGHLDRAAARRLAQAITGALGVRLQRLQEERVAEIVAGRARPLQIRIISMDVDVGDAACAERQIADVADMLERAVRHQIRLARQGGVRA